MRFEDEIKLLSQTRDKQTFKDTKALKKRLDHFIKKYGFPTKTRLHGSSIIVNSIDKSVIVVWYQPQKQLYIGCIRGIFLGLMRADDFEHVMFKLIKHQIL